MVFKHSYLNVFLESHCMDMIQTTQKSSFPITEVNTTVSVQMGKKVLLSCPPVTLTKALVITWVITPRGGPVCIIAYKADTKETRENNCTDRRITWASTPDLSPDLQITTVALEHAGYYSCEIAASECYCQKGHDLQVLVPPEVTLFSGENRTAVCEASAGKPAAQIFWTPDGDCATKSEPHSNGTVTVRSTCHWEQNNVSAVVCSVSHSTGNRTLSIELNRGTAGTLHSLLTILYVKCGLLGIVLLNIAFAFFQKRNYFRSNEEPRTLAHMYWRTKTVLRQGVGLMDEADREGRDFLSELMMPVLIKYFSLFWFPTMK
ncbi:cell surface glycoprotein CD200 receptor 2-like [Psammomys obesus]|uniref:cell surface glycoprotein CD200 receptor 2-like n=1 Tax=Psammomys obesus TaxID=48139 RepID=UPI002452FCE2|nr:cell surface glycoprotein CD200 receptor 2-like [Psammomys obesus]